MNKKVGLILAGISLLVLSSCSNRLVGTWNIDKYDVTNNGNQGVILKNVGTLTLNKKGQAIKNVDLNFFTNASAAQTEMRWSEVKGKTVTLSGNDTDFAKTWIVVENKKKTQKWKATDGANGVQSLELSKR